MKVLCLEHARERASQYNGLAVYIIRPIRVQSMNQRCEVCNAWTEWSYISYHMKVANFLKAMRMFKGSKI